MLATLKERNVTDIYIVNDRLDPLGAYLKIKTFGWFAYSDWVHIKKHENKNNKKCQASNFLKICLKKCHKSPSLPFIKISGQF